MSPSVVPQPEGGLVFSAGLGGDNGASVALRSANENRPSMLRECRFGAVQVRAQLDHLWRASRSTSYCIGSAPSSMGNRGQEIWIIRSTMDDVVQARTIGKESDRIFPTILTVTTTLRSESPGAPPP